MPGGPLSFLAHSEVLDAWLPHRRTQPSRRNGSHRIYVGDGEPVLVLPEFSGGPETTSALRHVLRDAGFAPYDWGLGVDNGPEHGLSRLLRQIEERVIDVFEADHRAVTLLGLGLSGIYAREVAKRTSPLVKRVITIGTPLRIHDPSGSCFMLRALYSPRSGVDKIAINRMRQRPPVASTSIYTITDEAVRWDLSEDVESLTSENVVVPAHRHHDLAMHPMTIEAITQRIAQPEPDWQAFEE
jgi:predicted RNA binding protein YcfA (HicA-like mRNA interferase family)